MAMQVGLNVIVGLVLRAMGKLQIAAVLLISGGVVAGAGFTSWLVLLSIYG